MSADTPRQTVANSVAAQPPGTILQLMYVRERLRGRRPGTFIEVGVGKGLLTKLLLDLGWRGVAFELNEQAVAAATALNLSALRDHRLVIHNADWLNFDAVEPADLVISSMVLEHLDDQAERHYLEKCAAALSETGLGVLIVPASPAHWGIEDDMVGHYRRYTFESMRQTLTASGFSISHLAGLTFPLSNLLLRLSNKLVGRQSDSKRDLSKLEQTKASGMLQIGWKTNFPDVIRWFVNPVTLYPFYVLQNLNRANPRSLVLYAEFMRQASAARKLPGF